MISFIFLLEKYLLAVDNIDLTSFCVDIFVRLRLLLNHIKAYSEKVISDSIIFSPSKSLFNIGCPA